MRVRHTLLIVVGLWVASWCGGAIAFKLAWTAGNKAIFG